MGTTSFPFGRRATVRLSFAAAVVPLVVFVFGPAVAVLVLAFTDIRSLPGLPVHWIGFDNFATFFNAAHLADSLATLKNTVLYAGLLTLGQVGLGLAIAVLLNRKLAGRNFLRSLVFMPVILGVTVTALIWSLVFSIYGPVQHLLNVFGTESAFFGDPKIAIFLVVFVAIWANVGVTVVIFLAGLQAIPVELYEVASIDGASGGQIFRHITFPMLAPSVTTNTLLGLIGSLQSYQLIYVLTGYRASTKVFSLAVFQTAFGTATNAAVTQGYAAAISMVQFVFVGVIAAVVMTYLRRREARL